MPFIDRTQEFFSIVESKQSQIAFESKKPKTLLQPKKPKNHKSLFYERAAQASKDLQRTAETLEKLASLIKKRTPFDDNAENIQHLTLMVKEQLHSNSLLMKELKDLLQEQQQEQQAAKHSNTIVSALDSRLAYVADQFQSVLKTRTKQIKQQRERKNLFVYDSPNNLYNNRVVQKPKAEHNTKGETMISFGGDSNEQQNDQNEIAMHQEQEQGELVLNMNDQYLKERTDEILQIEKSIVDLSDMYKDLAIMIKQQGELAMSIERNVEDAVFNVEQAQSQLTSYLNKVSGHRGLILKVFFVLVAFIIFISVFVLR